MGSSEVEQSQARSNKGIGGSNTVKGQMILPSISSVNEDNKFKWAKLRSNGVKLDQMGSDEVKWGQIRLKVK